MIQMPLGWSWGRLSHAAQSIGSARPEEYWGPRSNEATRPVVRRIGMAEIQTALAQGFEDFKANRTDVVFLCILYPVVGLLLGRLASGYGLLPMLFPLASGFALVGPVAGIGLNEMSRRREAGLEVKWTDAFKVLQSPSIGSIVVLALLLGMLLAVWLTVAGLIYVSTLGPDAPTSVGSFAHDVMSTQAGWGLVIFGCGAGFIFAVLALAISVVSFPLLLDRNVGVDVAIATSVRAVVANPLPMLIWGAVITGGLVLGSIPVLLGLAVVLPVLGHATWHLYRQVVET